MDGGSIIVYIIEIIVWVYTRNRLHLSSTGSLGLEQLIEMFVFYWFNIEG